MSDSGFAARYELIRKLGEGGMGSVWLARDKRLGRRVAVKSLLVQGQSDERKRAMALKEARAAARLSHPNIVGVIELIDSAADGGPWIVMEYVEGKSLAAWIRDHPDRLTEPKIAELGRAVLRALAAMHAAGVIHRDVKPENILIRRVAGPPQPLSSQVCLVDFGNAAIEGEATTKSLLIGTLGYIAPERFLGPAGPASDLWSLGVTLYHAVERRLPFQRDSEPQVMYAVVHEPPDAFARARLLVPVIRHLLNKDPAERPDVAAVFDLLSQALPTRGPRSGGSAGGSRSGGSAGGPRSGDSAGGPRSGDSAVGAVTTRGFAAIVAGDPEEAVKVLRGQGPREAARIIGRMPADSAEAVTLAALMPDSFAADLLEHLAKSTATAILLRLPSDRAVVLLDRMPKVSAAALLAALPPQDQATAALMAALPDPLAARLLDETPLDPTLALLGLLGLRRTGVVIAGMSQRRVAEVLDVVPADLRKALMLLRSLPSGMAGGVLDRMSPGRVADILQAGPADASRLLRLMQRREQRAVIDRMSGLA